jgi:sulfoxide reductase heme-binding subunit YedZ
MKMITKNDTPADQVWSKAQLFAFSLTAGLAAGLALLLGGWILLNMAFGASFVGAVGITEKTPWYFSRSAGTIAYVLLAGSTIWGLLLSSKLFKTGLPASLSLALHNILSWLAILFTTMHALALLWDSYYTYSVSDLIFPFLGPYRPGWVGLGIISFYMMFITALSFNFRKQIGQKRWRQLHYAAFVLYLSATIHGIMAGTDSGNIGMNLLYWASGLGVLFLTLYRFKPSKTAAAN